AHGLIVQQLHELHAHGLLADVDAVARHLGTAASLAEALDGVQYVQESSPEDVEIKRALFTQLGALSPPDAVLASSTSSTPTSAFTEHVNRRARCLVAHPVNPPYLIPGVQLSRAPWTSPEVVAQARRIM